MYTIRPVRNGLVWWMLSAPSSPRHTLPRVKFPLLTLQGPQSQQYAGELTAELISLFHSCSLLSCPEEGDAGMH